MKRKFKEAIETFNQIEAKHNLNEYLKPLFYQYRAYGYFCTGQHQQALADYLVLDQIKEGENGSNKYNKFLCEGILSVQD